jgi:hypothetical protein
MALRINPALHWLGGKLESALVHASAMRAHEDQEAVADEVTENGAQDEVVTDDESDDEWVNIGMQHLDMEAPFYVVPRPCALERSESNNSAASVAEYHAREETIIIFDWDDTLCPTTTCQESLASQGLTTFETGHLPQALDRLSRDAADLLVRASELAAKVVIITNASKGWIETCCEAWMPELLPTLRNIDLISARSIWEPLGVDSPTGWKEGCFETEIRKFYSRRRHQTWKNIIVVGDARYEHEALRRVVMRAPHRGNEICRSKSVKFAARPSVEALAHEIRMLNAGLGEIVMQDGNLNIGFTATWL